jgi:hypothetical protein
MRTIKTKLGTYKIADSRNLEEFLKQLKKPKSLAKRFKADKKTFPVFFAGKTSTRHYVEAYYHLNHQASPQYVENLFGLLSANSSPDFAIEEDVIEVKLCS